MKALVISPQPFFSFRGTPFSVYYRTLVTARMGVKVDLLTYGEGEDVDIPGVRIIRIPRLPGCHRIKVGPSLLKAFLDVFMIAWTVALLLRFRYDLVHAHEESVFWARSLKPLFRFKLIYDMHSSLPQQLTNFHFTRSKLLIGLFAWLEKSVLRVSDAVIAICPDLYDQALKNGVEPKRALLIENSLFEPVRLKRSRNEGSADDLKTVKPPSGTRVVYAGTFEPYQGVDLLIRGFAQARRHRSDLELVLVGGTPDQVRNMKRLADDCDVDGSCLFVGQVSRETAAEWLASANAVASPRLHGTNTPLKLYELLAAKKPIIATNIWSHTQVLSPEVCFLVEPTPESMAEGILAAVSELERARMVTSAARRLYEEKYSPEIYQERMRRLLDVVMPTPCAE